MTEESASKAVQERDQSILEEATIRIIEKEKPLDGLVEDFIALTSHERFQERIAESPSLSNLFSNYTYLLLEALTKHEPEDTDNATAEKVYAVFSGLNPAVTNPINRFW